MSAVPTPKDRFTSLDTLALVRELRAVRHARVDKVFDLPAGGWSLALRVPREGRRELLLVPGRFAALLSEATAHADELSPSPGSFGASSKGRCSKASPTRPESDSSRSRSAARTNHNQSSSRSRCSERATWWWPEEVRSSRSPETRRWAHRTVAIGSEYARPPTRTDPWTVGVAEIEAELSRSRTDLASTLGARLALGGPLAEEIVARGGWAAAGAAASEAGRLAPELHRVLRELLSEVGDHPSGFLYLRGGIAVDATPYRSHRWREVGDVEEVSRPTFSAAVAEYFPTLVAAPVSAEEKERTQVRKDLEHRLDQQRAAVLELSRRIEELKADAAAVFDHYPEAEIALEDARHRGEKGPSLEVSLGDRKVSLLLEESPRNTAQRLFEEAKRVQAKLNGAVSAIAEAETKLGAFAAAPVSTRPRPTRVAAESRAKRSHWFERYRWFISSEGAVVVGGRDAGSNDQMVKRHLKEGDVYVHADLHGAASVIVKHPPPGGPPLTETTYREAGQWAVAFSKAWRAGLASVSAFWVTHDQVSKAAMSGEFVARGAWVIHGTKHALKDLPNELALGTIDYEGESLWTTAPPEALRRRGTIRSLLTPGPERERSEREEELVRELGIPRPLLQSLLPAGGISVRRP